MRSSAAAAEEPQRRLRNDHQAKQDHHAREGHALASREFAEPGEQISKVCQLWCVNANSNFRRD
jgi:hypothetical protein